jgi:NAD-dependent SIR2 family protein deacetylase
LSSNFEKGKKFSWLSSRPTSKAEFHASVASQALYRRDREATHHAERGRPLSYLVWSINSKVDGLLHGAFNSLGSFEETELDSLILELHGSLRYVICLHCHQKTLRTYVQAELARLNPRWTRLISLSESDLKTNADGDVDLGASSLGSDELFEYRSFRYPPCPVCLSRYGDSEALQLDHDGAWVGGSAGIIKPAVTFFGENVPDKVRDTVNGIVERSDQILVIGTTLAVLSAQRLVRMAKAQGKRIAIMTSGYVRNEETLVHDNDLRIWWKSSEVFEHISYLSSLR